MRESSRTTRARGAYPGVKEPEGRACEGVVNSAALAGSLCGSALESCLSWSPQPPGVSGGSRARRAPYQIRWGQRGVAWSRCVQAGECDLDPCKFDLAGSSSISEISIPSMGSKYSLSGRTLSRHHPLAQCQSQHRQWRRSPPLIGCGGPFAPVSSIEVVGDRRA